MLLVRVGLVTSTSDSDALTNPALWGAVIAFVTAGLSWVITLVTTRQRLKDHIVECERYRNEMNHQLDRIHETMNEGFREMRSEIRARRQGGRGD